MNAVGYGLVGGIVLGSALTLRGLWARGWELREEDEQQLRLAFATAALALCTASLLRDAVSLPVLVVSAGLVGWVPVQVLSRSKVVTRLRRVAGGPYRARTYGWFGIAVLALASTAGLLTFRIATMGFAVAMAIWNSRRVTH